MTRLHPTFNGGLGTTNSCHQKSTSDLLASPSGAEILALGDNQYEDGTVRSLPAGLRPELGQVQEPHPPGRRQPRVPDSRAPPATSTTSTAPATRPVQPASAARATTASTSAAGTSIALNSNCADGRRLRRRVAAGAVAPRRPGGPPDACTLAYWHHPLFSSGAHGNDAVDAARSGRRSTTRAPTSCSTGTTTSTSGSHRRTRPARPTRARHPRSSSSGPAAAVTTPLQNVQPNSEVRCSDTFGVLKLTLHDDGLRLGVPSRGRQDLHRFGLRPLRRRQPDAAPPSAPSGLSATRQRRLVDLGWTASTRQRGSRRDTGCSGTAPRLRARRSRSTRTRRSSPAAATATTSWRTT